MKRCLIPRFVATAVLILLAAPGYSQFQVNLKYPSTFEFIPSDLWNVAVINTGTTSQTIYLVGTVKDVSQNLLLKEKSTSFSVSPGTHFYTSSGITTSSTEYYNSSIQSAISQTGRFPASSYITCVDVYTSSTDEKVGGNCVENSVEIISPPHLSYPEDQAVVDNAYPVFSWTPASPLRGNEAIDYKIKIVELSENQSAVDGISRNPAYYDGDMNANLILSYSYDNLPFEENKMYAWQITASIGDFMIGPSEVWQFSYKPAPIDSLAYGLTDNYLLLKQKTDGAYYLANGAIKFRFNDEYHTGIKNINLLTTSNNDITPENLSLKKPFNDDRYVVDLQGINEVDDGSFYLLKVKTNAGQAYTIRFKYIKPGNK